MARSWVRVRRWRWAILFVGLVVAGLLALDTLGPSWTATIQQSIVTGVLTVGFFSLAVGYAASTTGSVDSDRRVLSYRKPPVTVIRDGGVVDLTYLRSVRVLRFDRRALVWLGFVPGTPNRFLLQGFYVLPVSVLDRYEAVFCVDAEPTIDPIQEATARRRESLSVLGGYVLLTLGVVLAVSWVGHSVSLIVLAMVAVVIAAVGALVLVETLSAIRRRRRVVRRESTESSSHSSRSD